MGDDDRCAWHPSSMLDRGWPAEAAARRSSRPVAIGASRPSTADVRKIWRPGGHGADDAAEEARADHRGRRDAVDRGRDPAPPVVGGAQIVSVLTQYLSRPLADTATHGKSFSRS